MQSEIQVLFDGWPLTYEPTGPAALHLWEIIHNLPEETAATLAFPATPPTWFAPPAGLIIHLPDAADTSQSRLRWEQRTLPGLAGELGIDLVHLTHSHPALFSGIPVVVSPTTHEAPPPSPGLAGRLRSALGQGALTSNAGILWPNDLPVPDGQAAVHQLFPTVSPDFHPSADPPSEGSLELPETFILYHGSYREQALNTLFESWVWGAGALGDYYPLLLLDCPKDEWTNSLIDRYNFGEAVQMLPQIPTHQVSEVYRQASALIHPEQEPPWGGPLRHALACEVPIVTTDHPANSALVGSGAYTLPEECTRKLGASLITVIVEEEVAEKLSNAAREQTSDWDPEHYRTGLGQSYRSIVNK